MDEADEAILVEFSTRSWAEILGREIAEDTAEEIVVEIIVGEEGIVVKIVTEEEEIATKIAVEVTAEMVESRTLYLFARSFLLQTSWQLLPRDLHHLLLHLSILRLLLLRLLFPLPPCPPPPLCL